VLRRIGIEHVHMMAQTVAPTLSSLFLRFVDEDDESDLDCYEVVEVFFSSCLQIRCLRLEFFDFGDDPTFLTPTIMDGFGRLKELLLSNCQGDLIMFAELAPIQNLSKIDFVGYAIDASAASAIISAIAMKCRSLKTISLYAHFRSRESIHKIVEYCRDLEEITIVDYSLQFVAIKISEFVAIASLPRLKSLDLTNCKIDGGAISPLARCNGLRNLLGASIKLSSDVVQAIGGNLMKLQCNLGSVGLEEIVEYCPNLVDFDISIDDEASEELDHEERFSAVGLIKRGLKKLTKLKINGRTIRLGTD
jgi:hypothetical protein